MRSESWIGRASGRGRGDGSEVPRVPDAGLVRPGHARVLYQSAVGLARGVPAARTFSNLGDRGSRRPANPRRCWPRPGPPIR